MPKTISVDLTQDEVDFILFLVRHRHDIQTPLPEYEEQTFVGIKMMEARVAFKEDV